jgi:hypothetical protein
MQKIIKETELLETQKNLAQGQLQLVQNQIYEAELKLKQLQNTPSENK